MDNSDDWDEEDGGQGECDNCEEQMSDICRWCEHKLCPECAEVGFTFENGDCRHQELYICYNRISNYISELDAAHSKLLMDRFVAHFGSEFVNELAQQQSLS